MHLAAAPHLAAVPRYVAGRSANGRARALLGSNESAIGPSPRALQAAGAALADAHRYPLDGAPALSAALARHHAVGAGELLVTNGSSEAITLLTRAFPGDVIVPAGTFPAYARSATGAGLTTHAIPRRGHHADLDAMAAAVTPRTGLIFLANPDNPTGTEIDAPALGRWLAALPQHVVVVLDEAYRAYAPVEADGLALRALHPNVVVLRTFSKAYGLAALRVGYAVGSAGLIDALDRVRDAFNVSTAGEAAACAALADAPWLAAVVATNARRRTELLAGLRARGHAAVASRANFVFVPDAAVLGAHLLSAGFAVRALDGWGHPGGVRITVGTDAEHAALFAAIDLLRLSEPSRPAVRTAPGAPCRTLCPPPARPHRPSPSSC